VPESSSQPRNGAARAGRTVAEAREVGEDGRRTKPGDECPSQSDCRAPKAEMLRTGFTMPAERAREEARRAEVPCLVESAWRLGGKFAEVGQSVRGGLPGPAK